MTPTFERPGRRGDAAHRILALLPPDVRSRLEHGAELEARSFDDLRRSYNFHPDSDQRAVFTWVVLHEIIARSGGPVRALDIGCGRGIGRDPLLTRAIAALAGELWGVEPDPRVRPDPALFRECRTSSLEESRLPGGAFDLAYSYMVMEHVADPGAFLREVARCLRPGGVYVFATPNRRHYFTRLASVSSAFRVEDAVFASIPGSAEDRRRYPLRYRCNTEGAITRLAGDSGFSRAQFAYFEGQGPRALLGGPLRPVHIAMNAKRRISRRPRNLLGLFARLTRAT
jgi:2-polyprenyl-3-methyl-5-hydroxy-6-metoxy-1,4-benzoquinol methylase